MKHTSCFIFDKLTGILEITIHHFAIKFTYVIFHQVSVQRMNIEFFKNHQKPEDLSLLQRKAMNDSPASDSI